MQEDIKPEIITEADRQLTDHDMDTIKVFFDEYTLVMDELESLSLDAISANCGLSKETARKQYSCTSSNKCQQKAKPLFDRKRELTAQRAKCCPKFIAEKFYMSQHAARRLYTKLAKQNERALEEPKSSLSDGDIASIEAMARKYWPIKKELKKYTVDGMARMVGQKKHNFSHAACSQNVRAPWAEDAKRVIAERDSLKSKADLCSPKFVSEQYGISVWAAEKIFKKVRAEK